MGGCCGYEASCERRPTPRAESEFFFRYFCAETLFRACPVGPDVTDAPPLASITATTDLTEELKKEAFAMDAVVANKIVDSMIRLLEDSAKEVQDVAVKALGPLVRKVSEQHVMQIIAQLSQNVANDKRGKAELREVSNSGLKAVLRGCDDALGDKVSAELAPKLVAAVNGGNLDIQQECLDVINDLLTRFGANTSATDLQAIQAVTLPCLDSDRNLIKQRSIWVLTNVARHCTEAAFGTLSAALITKLGGALKKQATAIQLVGSMARDVGFRMGKHVQAFVPPLATAVNKSSADGDEDIKENAFQAFGSFVEACPRDTRAHIDTILTLCLKYVAWDPNTLDDDDADGGGSGSEAGSGSDDEGSEGEEQSDEEDDKTWMVRRAAAKCITLIVAGHPDRLDDVVTKAGPELVKRFKERESTARHEVLGAYEAIAVAVGRSAPSAPCRASFAAAAPKAIAALALVLSHKSADTRAAAVSVLRTVATHVPGALDSHLKTLLPGITSAVADSNVQLRVAALELVTIVLAGKGNPTAAQPHLEALLVPVEALLKGGNLSSRVAAVAMGACEAFLVAGAGKNDFLIRVYRAFEPIYKQTDVDSETKEAAIRAAARAVCNLGSNLPNVAATLDTLCDRLGAELTREAATVAVGTIAESAAALGDAWLAKAVPLLGGFCGAAPRSLKIAALSSLSLVMENYGDIVKTHAQVLDDSAGLIDPEDMTLAQLAVTVATRTVHANPKALAGAKKALYPNVLSLLPSPLLEGNSLSAVAEFFSEVVRLDAKGLGFAELAKDLEAVSAKAAAADVFVFRNVGSCLAQVITCGDHKAGAATVDSLVKRVASKTEAERLAAIYALAEVGRLRDAGDYSGVLEALTVALDAESRAVALAASFALGSVAIGNLAKFLPYIVGDMKKNPKRQLLLLQSIKEIVSGNQTASAGPLRISLSASMAGSAAQDIAVHLDTLLPILFEHSASPDDLTRNAVAECLGRLAKLASDRIIPELHKRASDKSAFARATVVNALRYATSERPNPELDAQLGTVYGAVAASVTDPDIGVRLSGLQTIAWCLATKPAIIKPHLVAALPGVYKETVKDESLITVIDLGQIKHITDNGMDKRTAAYDVLYVLLDTAFDAIAVADYVDPLLRGMGDERVIREQAFKILRRLAQVAGGQVLGHLETILPVLEKEVKSPIPKSEPFERFIVMKRAAFQAALALNAIPNSNAKLQQIAGLKYEKLDEKLKAAYDEVLSGQSSK